MVPPPDSSLRLMFFQRKLPDVNSEVLDRLAESTDGLSFAHLQEVLRLSGLLAIRAGRSARSDEDLTEAVELVRRGHEDAARGFAPKPEMPFGLAALRRKPR
jgi:ATP-dependent 26S proteasome regulatory subunit